MNEESSVVLDDMDDSSTQEPVADGSEDTVEEEKTIIQLVYGANYKGYLKNKPKKTAMEQLLEVRDPELLDTYLVERDYIFEGDYVSEIYTWYGNESGWVFSGSTNLAGTIQNALPENSSIEPIEPPPVSEPTTNEPTGSSNNDSIFVEFTPKSNLPEYPTYATQVVNGIKYKVYLETGWERVITQDGISLKDLIKALPVYDPPAYYHYKGYLKNKPKKSAMEQLLEIKNPEMLDIYLVERDYTYEGEFVSEIYTWYGYESGWVYQGSTNPVGTIQHALPGILDLIPETLGEPADFLLVTEDGKGITWGNPLRDHMNDPNSHPDIRKLIDDIVVPKIKMLSDVLHSELWVYNPITEYYEYDYSNDGIAIGAYFEITPMIDDLEISEIIRKSEINPSYPILFSQSHTPHAMIRAVRPPQADIPISVRIFGEIEEVTPTQETGD